MVYYICFQGCDLVHNIIDEIYNEKDDTIKRFILKKNPTREYNCYQIDCYLIKSNGDSKLLGYTYFRISPNGDFSSYIGTYVNSDFRRCGIGNMLISEWIKFCFNNGMEDLRTIRRQRKPMVLYLLKKLLQHTMK